MTNYSHTAFAACTTKQFRAGLLVAIRADLKIDANDALENIRNGIIRHGVWVNGRHIGYEAIVDASGEIRVTEIKALQGQTKRHHTMKTMDQMRKQAEDIRTVNAIMSGEWGA